MEKINESWKKFCVFEEKCDEPFENLRKYVTNLEKVFENGDKF